MKPNITGYIQLSDKFIFLSSVIGIYPDRKKPGSPKRYGHWIKVRADNVKGLVKIYTEELTKQQLHVLRAVSSFNQSVDMLEFVTN